MAELARADGGTLSYESWGDPEAPPVLLLHDLLADHRAWFPCMLALAEEYRVLAPDLPGHGLSSPLPADGSHDIEQLARMVVELLQAEDVGLCAIAGCGLGALVALQLALAAPETAAAVVLADLPGGTQADSELSAPASDRAAVAMRRGIAELGKRAAVGFADPFLAGGVRARYRRTDPESYAAAGEAMGRFADARPSLRGRLAMPVLLLAPDAGPLRSAAQAAAEELEQGRLALFRDVETSVLASRPDAVCDVIVEFFHDIEDRKPIAAQLVR